MTGDPGVKSGGTALIVGVTFPSCQMAWGRGVGPRETVEVVGEGVFLSTLALGVFKEEPEVCWSGIPLLARGLESEAMAEGGTAGQAGGKMVYEARGGGLGVLGLCRLGVDEGDEPEDALCSLSLRLVSPSILCSSMVLSS